MYNFVRMSQGGFNFLFTASKHVLNIVDGLLMSHEPEASHLDLL